MSNPQKTLEVQLDEQELGEFQKTLRKIASVDGPRAVLFLRRSVKAYLGTAAYSERTLRLYVLYSLIGDLLEQRWEITKFDKSVQKLFLTAPSIEIGEGETMEDVKDRIRSGLTAISNKQLASPSVQDFIRRMESPREYKGRIISILDLVDSGKELSKEIRRMIAEKEDLEEGLNNLIKPFVELCEDGIVCAKTGLPLLDVWRYFRHTWSLEYKPTPGRTMRLLIRNKARPNWPIIGIAMLASPAMNLYIRDEWIGWRFDDLFNGLADGKLDPVQIGKILFENIKESLSKIRKDDLLSKEEVNTPDERTLLKLKQIALSSQTNRHSELVEREEREKFVEEGGDVIDIRSLGANDKINWKQLSSTSLYRKKRAEMLGPILRSYWMMKGARIEKEPATAVYALLSTKRGRDAISVALNELRKARLASQVADVSVCGSIAPYNELLGGKLVTMLMGSSEVKNIYQKKYDGQISEIASQLAGKPIRRSAELLALTTTSLYGIGSSQYNRIKFPAKYVRGLSFDFEWQKLQLTAGFGITHISDETVMLMRKLSILIHGARRVNSVFGEGSSPRVRLIRDAMILLGMKDDSIMRHGLSRIVYAHEYYKGSCGDLSGFKPTSKANHIPSVSALSKAWIKRWIVNRVSRPEIRQRLKEMAYDVIATQLKQRVNGYLELHDPSFSD